MAETTAQGVVDHLQHLLVTYQTLLVALQFFYLTALFLTHNTHFELVGLTGGIASGKSTASHHIATAHRLPVIDLDRISKGLTTGGGSDGGGVLRGIRREFGGDVFTATGALDRAALGALVWQDAARRARLNALYRWPLLRGWVGEVARVGWARRGGVVVLDVPLLYETGMWRACREAVCVYCDEGTQLRRLQARDGVGEEAARAKVARQWRLEEKRRRCDVVIENGGTVEELKAKVDEWLRWRREKRPTYREWFTPSLPCVVVSLLIWLPVWIAYASWWVSRQWIGTK